MQKRAAGTFLWFETITAGGNKMSNSFYSYLPQGGSNSGVDGYYMFFLI